MRAFQKLNPKRTLHSKVPLNQPQQQYLLHMFFNTPGGGLKNICVRCLKSYFGIGGSVYNKIQKAATSPTELIVCTNLMGKHGNSGKLPSNSTESAEPKILELFDQFINNNTHPDPTRNDTRLINYNIGSRRRLWHEFVSFVRSLDTIVDESVLLTTEKQREDADDTSDTDEEEEDEEEEDNDETDEDFTAPIISRSTFERLLARRFPTVKRAQQTKDACNECILWMKAQESFHKWQGHTRLTSGPEYEEKKQTLETQELQHQKHMKRANAEYEWYQTERARAKTEWSEIREKLVGSAKRPRCTVDATVHIAVDAMRTSKVPHLANRPQANTLYYLNKLSVYNVGVYDEGSGKGLGYLWDETLSAVSANHVINVIWFWITSFSIGEKKLRITMDNCSVNKNFMVRRSSVRSSNRIEVIKTYIGAGHCFCCHTRGGWMVRRSGY